jgi:dienelactone hydrolase
MGLLNKENRGEPTGKSIKIGSIEAYVAEPTGKNIHKGTAILYLPDVIGIWQNSQLMADQLAVNGYYTIIPDLFNGDALKLNQPADFNLMEWLAKGTGGNNPHTYEYVDPIVEKSIAWLKEQGFKKIGSVGYCFVRQSTFLPFLTFVQQVANVLNREPNTLFVSCQRERASMSVTLLTLLS